MTTTSTATATTSLGRAAARPPRAALLRRAGRDQAVVAGGQVLAGVGNLVFIAAAARFLEPAAFSQLAAFAALLAIANLPGSGLAAMGAVDPRRARVLVQRAAVGGAAVGVALALGSGVVSSVLGMPVPIVLALAAAAPAAPLLGLRRGLAYGARDHRSIVLSLLAEPFARLSLGVALGLSLGAVGAAWGVTAGGWLALVAMGRLPRPGRHARHVGGATAATGLAFVGLTLLQHLDLVLANRVLSSSDAGAFAALSTLGGLVAFATATLPLVLLPAATRNEAGGLPVALGAAVAVALGAVVVAAVAGELVVAALVGERYEHIAPLLPAYLAAMGALGIGRVLAAHRCARGGSAAVVRIVVLVAAAQVLGIVTAARSPGQVVVATAVPLAAGAVVLGLPQVWDRAPRERVLAARASGWIRHPDAPILVGLTLVALLVRLATERSLWVDEAISIGQAQLPLGEMLADLRATDVHPPLHFLFLWVGVRVLGTAEWAVRLPSVLFGAALVPVMYAAGKELFDRRTGLVAAALAVPAPFLVWYSQEARMYSLFMLIGVIGVWAQVAALRRGGTVAFVAWGAASAALIWTQWFALLPLAVQQLATVVHLVRCRRGGHLTGRLVRRWLGSLALTALLVAPLVPYLSEQLAAYGERGAGLAMPGAAGTDASSVAEGLSSYAAIANLLWALGGYHSDSVMLRLGAVWPIAMLACLLLLGRRLQRSTSYLIAVAVVPAAMLFVIGYAKRDLFELRYFVLAAPLLLLVVARAATTLARSQVVLASTVAGLVALSSVALVDQQLNGTNPRLYDFRGAVAEIHRTAAPGDVIAHSPDYLVGVLDYYAPDLAVAELAGVDPQRIDGQIYVVVTERFLTPGRSGEIGDQLARLAQVRGEPERFERPNVIVWRFS